EERLQGFKPGAAILFKIGRKDGKDYLVGIKLDDGSAAGGPPRELPKVDSSKLVPLTDMGPTEYQGSRGGLYPDGSNKRPAAHEPVGLALARQVQPLDAAGKPADRGRIVMVSVGMSNTNQASTGFERALKGEQEKNPRFVFVNGAMGGATAA